MNFILEFRIISRNNVYGYCFLLLSFGFKCICYGVYWVGGMSFKLKCDIIFIELVFVFS